jgi:peptidyl-prolyl cis-trans isomerase SurA
MRLTILLLMAVGTVGLAQNKRKESAAPVLFTIQKKPIYSDEFIYLYKKNHTQPGDFTEAKEDEYLNLLINFKLKITDAHLRGMDTTATFLKEYNTYKEDLKKPYLAGVDDLDRLTKEAYEHLKEEIKASHILIAVKQDALPNDTLVAFNKISAIRERALQGEDFSALARELSEDPSAKTNSGNLGYFTTMQMVYPFENAAYKTPKGGISGVLRTRFGYHILKVMDRMMARGEVEVSHILLRTSKGNNDQVKKLIFEIDEQLKGGRPWDDLCKQYSEDTNTKNTGGRLKPFGIGALPGVPEFEQVAFSLKNPGDISDPFQSNIGWHIIKLEKKIPVPPYKDMEAALKRRVSKDERLQISKTNTLQKRKTDFGFTENTSAKKSIYSLADSSLVLGKWKYAGKDQMETLFTLQSKPVTTGEFIAYVSKSQSQTSLKPAGYIDLLYNRFVEMKINEAEENKLVAENPDYRMLLNEYKEGILLFEIMEKQVWNKASADSAGQRQYYLAHPDKYSAGNRVEARIFMTPDKAFKDEMTGKINKGDTLTAADARRFKSIQNKKAYERGENKIIDKVNWVPGIQETEADGMYYLVEIIRLILPGLKTFDEARASIISDYQDSLEKAWVVQLREKYPVKINKKARKSVIEQLKK